VIPATTPPLAAARVGEATSGVDPFDAEALTTGLSASARPTAISANPVLKR